MPPQQSNDQIEHGDQGIAKPLDSQNRQVSAEQWQNISTLKAPDAGRITAEHTVRELFGKVEIFELPAGQALEPPPQPGATIMSGPYDSTVKLNVQITNVPEVSAPVKPEEVLQHLHQAFEAGAQAVRPIEQWMATPDAVTDALVSIGPALDNAVNYYANTPADQRNP